MPTPRTVLHGIDQSGTSLKRFAWSAKNMGAVWYDEDVHGLRVYNTDMNRWVPAPDIPFVYDPSGTIDSGAIGEYNLRGGDVPRGFIITDVWIDVVRTFTSATDTARIGLMVKATGDIATALRINNPGNPWDAAVRRGIPDNTIAKAIRITQNARLQVRVETEALTAGTLYGVLKGFMSESATAEEESSSSGSSSSSSSSSSNSSSSSCSNSSSSSSSCSNSSSSSSSSVNSSSSSSSSSGHSSSSSSSSCSAV